MNEDMKPNYSNEQGVFLLAVALIGVGVIVGANDETASGAVLSNALILIGGIGLFVSLAALTIAARIERARSSVEQIIDRLDGE